MTDKSVAVTRIQTWVVSATTRSTNHYTITSAYMSCEKQPFLGLLH